MLKALLKSAAIICCILTAVLPYKKSEASAENLQTTILDSAKKDAILPHPKPAENTGFTLSDVLWISFGISSLPIILSSLLIYDRRFLKMGKKSLREELDNRNKFCKTAKIYSFKLDCKTRRISGDLPQDIWPTKEGIAVESSNWIYERDIADWRNFYTELLSANRSEFAMTFRVFGNDKMRYIFIYLHRENPNSYIVSGIAKDATEIVENREKLGAANTKNDFIAAMSHEIRTPLNAVLGFADLLDDVHLDYETRKEYLNNISIAGNVLLSLINDILDLSKLAENKMKFTPAETSILELTAQIGLFFQPKCRSKNIKYTGAIADNLPTVWVDKLRLRQILFNLIGNAVKFTDYGSITVSADFEKTDEELGTLRLKVEDTGIGISDEEQKTLFSAFSQISDIYKSKRANSGTGLGLAICKKMSESMGGKLTLKSELGKGSLFTVELFDVKYKSKPLSETPKSIWDRPALKDYSRLSVLIVDDVDMNLAVMKSMLKKLHISAVAAINAKAALVELSKQKFDYVLTDLWMPGLSGAELARQIRNKYGKDSPHIAVVTADADGREHFDYSVFDAVLTKPVTILSIQRFFDEQQG